MKRLVLFDIDGTILSTHGAARRAFERAMIAAYGTSGASSTHLFDGKTDPQIVRELLRGSGYADAQIDAGLDRVWPEYLRNLEHELRIADPPPTVHPGVPELIAAIAQRTDEFVLGLLTGNIERGASIKLASVGLHEPFRFGAFGSDHETRSSLPEIAVRRARELTGASFSGRDVIIIGDTPSDVTCGASISARAVGVATGRYSTADLRAAGAAAVFRDLSHTDEVLACLVDSDAA